MNKTRMIQTNTFRSGNIKHGKIYLYILFFRISVVNEVNKIDFAKIPKSNFKLCV